jgi:hypothetical protein
MRIHRSLLPFLSAAISCGFFAVACSAQEAGKPSLPSPADSQGPGQATSIEALTPENQPAAHPPAANSSPLSLPPVTRAEANSLPLAQIIAGVDFLVEPQDMVIKGKHAIRIRVKNNSDRALVFNGEMATAKVGDTSISCMDNRDFDDLFDAPETFASNWSIGAGAVLTDALTVGTWQTVSDMLKTKSFKRYGADEERRDQDQERFGQRILWPGDSSSGIIVFPCEQSLSGAMLSLPVSSLFNGNDKAVVNSSSARASH